MLKLLEFATKRDVNGNRYYLGINYENKTYNEYSKAYPPAFLRKYAKIKF